jgi:DnaK suppressor protein
MTKDELLAMAPSDYMNDAQVGYFKDLLLAKAEEENLSIESARNSLADLGVPADPFDLASVEEERQALTRAIARHTANIKAIRYSLNSIRDGEFGYCEITGEEIGIGRLLAQPTARLSAEAQSIEEHDKRHFAAA